MKLLHFQILPLQNIYSASQFSNERFGSASNIGLSCEFKMLTIGL